VHASDVTSMIAIGFMAAAILPLAYYAFAIVTARQFVRRPAPPTHPSRPPVSILKPVRGPDPDAYDRYASFCRQEYSDYEVLFGVAELDDPAIPAIRRVMADLPDTAIRLVCPIPGGGPNAKMSIVRRLAAEARNDLFVVADSDVSAPCSLLARIADAFADPRVGLVTSLYRGDPANPTLASDLEALGIATDFIPGVLVAERLEGIRFALGAVMAVPRVRVQEIGGFDALLDCGADDFELGRRIAAGGYDIRLAGVVVSTACAPETLAAFLRHELRWTVTQRQSRPAAWLMKSAVTQGLPWSVAAALAAPSGIVAALYLGAYAALRLGVAWTVGVGILSDTTVRRRWWLLPVLDAVLCGVSIAALVTKRIEWRGRVFVLERGRLVPRVDDYD
jgi:ceramide glucosyltransferase